MKVLFILEYFPPYLGGVERLFDLLSSSLVNANAKVVVLTADYTGNLPLKEEKNGVEIHRVRVKNRFLFTLFCLPQALKLARNADLVHTTSYNAGFPAFLIGLLRRKKVIITFHEYWGRSWFKLPFLKAHERWLFFFYEQLLTRLPFHSVVAVSAFTEQRLKGAAKMRNVIKIYNGLPAQRKNVENTHQLQETNFVFVGRLGVSKGIDILVSAAITYLQDREAQFTFIVARQPAFMLDYIETRFAEAGKKENITILHEVDDEELKRAMLSSTAVVVPSYSEGFGFVAAEACALGVPVIHSGQGSLPEVVSGKSIAMHSYSASALVEAFVQAEEGLFNVVPEKHFSTSDTTEKYLALYQQMLNKP